nr:hypothetical protein [Candidatus Brocadia sapporoensis]
MPATLSAEIIERVNFRWAKTPPIFRIEPPSENQFFNELFPYRRKSPFIASSSSLDRRWLAVLSDMLAAVNMADYISGMLSKSLGVLAVEAATFSALTSSTYGIASMFFLMPDQQNQREQPHM